MTRPLLVALALLAASAPPAIAGQVTGFWTRDDGPRSFVSQLAEAMRYAAFLPGRRTQRPAKIGQQLFFDMKPNGENARAGSALNPSDGKRYTAKLTLSGDHLVTAGCVLGG